MPEGHIFSSLFVPPLVLPQVLKQGSLQFLAYYRAGRLGESDLHAVFWQLIVTVDGQLLGKFTAIPASNFTPTTTALTVMGPIRMGVAADEAFLGGRLVSYTFTTPVLYSTEPFPSAVYQMEQKNPPKASAQTLKLNQGKFVRVTAVSRNLFSACLQNGNQKALVETQVLKSYIRHQKERMKEQQHL